MRRTWFAELYFFFGLVLAALLGGWSTGGIAWWLLAAVTILMVRHGWQLRKLERWLGSGRQRNPPESWGVWGQVFDDYFRLQKRYYKRKKRLGKVIREFRESTAAMPDGSLVLDGQFHILWFNAAAERMLRLSSKRDLGQSLSNLVRNPRLSAYLAAGEFEQPIVLRSSVDETRSLSVRIIPYGSNQYLALFRDVTRMLRLQAMRRDFVANASHELRSPLTVLAGYIDSLADDPGLGIHWHKPVAEMQQQCQRMSSLVGDLLELSRLETEEPDPEAIDPVDVSAMGARIVREARLQDAEDHQVEFHGLAEAGLLGVERELHSAFANLVLNAIRYSGSGGTVQVTWRLEDNGQGVFEVSDNGIGIEEKHLPFITQRFYRIDSGRGRSKGGTGLGLAIVKHVLSRHGGLLEVSSEPGQGSTFRCVFPAERVTVEATRDIAQT